MKKIYTKPEIDFLTIEGNTILAASNLNKDIKTWSVEGANIQFDRNESNAYESGSLAKDFDFTLDLDYDF